MCLIDHRKVQLLLPSQAAWKSQPLRAARLFPARATSPPAGHSASHSHPGHRLMQLHHLVATLGPLSHGSNNRMCWRVSPPAIKRFRPEVMYVTSSHSLLARTSHVASLATGGRKWGSPMCPEGKGNRMWGSPGTSAQVVTLMKSSEFRDVRSISFRTLKESSAFHCFF